MLGQMMTTSNWLSILWLRCVLDAMCVARCAHMQRISFHSIYLFISFHVHLPPISVTITKPQFNGHGTKFQGAAPQPKRPSEKYLTRIMEKKIEEKIINIWKRNTPKVILIIAAWLNLNMLILFDLSRPMIFLFVNTRDSVQTADQQKGVPSFSWMWRLQINMIFSFSFSFGRFVDLLCIFCDVAFACTRAPLTSDHVSMQKPIIVIKKSEKCYWNTNTSP